MTDNKRSNSTITEQRVIEGLWLTYYNDTLLAKGVITQAAHNKMRLRIKSRAAAWGR